jgi:hypothetical protein
VPTINIIMATTLNVSDETHSNVLKLQAALNLTATSGAKYTIDSTVNTAALNCMSGVSFVQHPAAPMAVSYCATTTPWNPGVTVNTSQTSTISSYTVGRLSLREDK